MTNSIQPPLTAAEIRRHIEYVDATIATWEATDPTPRASLATYRACSVELHALLADMLSSHYRVNVPTLDFGGSA